MEPEKTPNSQSNVFWGGTKDGRLIVPDYKLLLQSCNHQDSMVLAQKETHRSMEQNKRTQRWTHNYMIK